MFPVSRLSLVLGSLSLLALAPVARAQYEMRGQVESSQVSTCYYCPPVSSWVIHGSETSLTSSTVNLASYDGLEVILTGTWTSISGLPLFDVTAVQMTTTSFNIGGNSSMGHTVHFDASGNNGDLAINIVALGAGVTPLSSTTTLLLAPLSAVILGFDVISGGTARTDFTIPSIPSLVGVHFFGQAMILPANGASFYFTEPDAKRIQ